MRFFRPRVLRFILWNFFIALTALVGLGLLKLRFSKSYPFRHTTAGRSSLDEGSAFCRDLCVTTHNTMDRHPCPGGIWTLNSRKRSAADPPLRPPGLWDRLFCGTGQFFGSPWHSGLLQEPFPAAAGSYWHFILWPYKWCSRSQWRAVEGGFESRRSHDVPTLWVFYVVAGRGHCYGLITRPEEPTECECVTVCVCVITCKNNQ